MFPTIDKLQDVATIPIKAEESREQARLVACLRKHWSAFKEEVRPVVFSVPNGGSRDVREASTLKVQGLLAGVSDLVLLLPKGEVIFVEMKAEKGRLSTSQTEFLNRINNLGFTGIVAFSAEDALTQLGEIL